MGVGKSGASYQGLTRWCSPSRARAGNVGNVSLDFTDTLTPFAPMLPGGMALRPWDRLPVTIVELAQRVQSEHYYAGLRWNLTGRILVIPRIIGLYAEIDLIPGLLVCPMLMLSASSDGIHERALRISLRWYFELQLNRGGHDMTCLAPPTVLGRPSSANINLLDGFDYSAPFVIRVIVRSIPHLPAPTMPGS
jgi:hypothetical protein